MAVSSIRSRRVDGRRTRGDGRPLVAVGPERVGVSEQVLLQLRAEDADRLAVLDVEGRDEASLADPEAGHVLVLGARADDLADALARLEAHLLVEELEGDDAHQTRHLLPDEERVVVGQAAREAGSVDEIISAIVTEHRPGDLVIIMSNGAFDGIHHKLLRALS